MDTPPAQHCHRKILENYRRNRRPTHQNKNKKRRKSITRDVDYNKENKKEAF